MIEVKIDETSDEGKYYVQLREKNDLTHKGTIEYIINKNIEYQKAIAERDAKLAKLTEYRKDLFNRVQKKVSEVFGQKIIIDFESLLSDEK